MSVCDIQPHQYPKFDPEAPCPIAPSKLASKSTTIRIQPAKKQANYSCSTAPWHVDDARNKSTPLIRDEHASQLNIEAYIHIYIQDTRDMRVPMHACITSGSVTMPTYGRTGESSCTWINYVNKQAIKSWAAKYQASDRLLPQHGSKPNQETSRPSQIASKPRPTTQPRSPSTWKQFKREQHATSAITRIWYPTTMTSY